MIRCRALALLTLAVICVASAANAGDTGIPVQYGSVPLAMPYNGANGNAVIGSKQVATSSIGNAFNSAVRADLAANLGGAYSSTVQSAYFAVNGQSSMLTQGQLGTLWGFGNGIGKGNVFFGNGVVNCYGGGEVGLPSSTPECVAAGEFDAFQGTYVWSATVTGSPGSGATTISYTSPTNNGYLGARAILNLAHVTGGTGTISSFTQCNQGSGGVCPGTCPGGTGSSCTVVQFAGSTINTTAGLTWYFKTVPNQNDYYSPACSGDDVSLPNAGGTGIAKCLGHWYQVATVNSATEITLYGSFDQLNLGTYIGTAGYVMVQGVEATDVNQVAQTITLPANSLHWNNGEFIYSPPSHYMTFNGMNLIFNKYYKTGFETAPSRGIAITNYGPALMDTGIIVSGGSGAGGFRTGIDLENLNIVSSVPGGSGEATNNTYAIYEGTDVNYALYTRSGALSPAKNMIALGTSGQSASYYDATTATTTFDGVDIRATVGVYGDGGGLKHKRITTGSIVASGFVGVSVPWTTTFADTNYTPVCSVLDASGNLTVSQVSAIAAGSITVDVKNGDGASAHTGTLLCHAMHD